MNREPADGALRGFFAVELERSLLDETSRVEGWLREQVASDVVVRWTRERGRHVTLRFLGRFAVERMSGLVAAARGALASAAPFDLGLGSVLAFPARRPRVLAVDPVPHGPLVSAAAALERAAVRCGFDAEPRSFRPHVTLGRVKRGALATGSLESGPAAGRALQRVGEVVLFRSELHPSGARYTPLERIALGGQSPPSP